MISERNDLLGKITTGETETSEIALFWQRYAYIAKRKWTQDPFSFFLSHAKQPFSPKEGNIFAKAQSCFKSQRIEQIQDVAALCENCCMFR